MRNATVKSSLEGRDFIKLNLVNPDAREVVAIRESDIDYIDAHSHANLSAVAAFRCARKRTQPLRLDTASDNAFTGFSRNDRHDLKRTYRVKPSRLWSRTSRHDGTCDCYRTREADGVMPDLKRDFRLGRMDRWEPARHSGSVNLLLVDSGVTIRAEHGLTAFKQSFGQRAVATRRPAYGHGRHDQPSVWAQAGESWCEE